VDNPTARDNVARFGEGQGCTVQVEENGADCFVHLARPLGMPGASDPAHPAPGAAPAQGPIVVVLPADEMGRGDSRLGQVLIRSFLHTLGEVQPRPATIICFNGGVRLAVEGSQVLEDLRMLEAQGVQILVCGTCLDYFGLKARIRAGQISNMYTIAETLLAAGRVVSL